MHDKKKILASLFPKAVLQAMTPEALAAMPAVLQATGMASMVAFPFRVGRESRVVMINNTLHRVERPTLKGSVPNNDIYLLDAGEKLQISREHFLIEQDATGYVLTDRGSHCGLTVAGRRVGAGVGLMSVPLRDGDLIAVGTADSQYVFAFITDFENTHW